MTALEYFKIKKRMTKTDNEDVCRRRCGSCLLSSANNGTELACDEFEMIYPEQAIAIVQKWAEEHPPKTMLQDYLEKYPKALIGEDGTPEICPSKLGHRKNDKCGNCVACWNRVLEEE